jgi:hypothetical protein
MAHSSKETLSIGWCDNGLTDGKFTEGLVYTMITAPTRGVSIHNAIRVQGNQIGRQRQALFAMWFDQIKTDWLLWVDSDIVLTADVLKLLWDTADKIQRPVVCGVYFISKEIQNEVFNQIGKKNYLKIPNDGTNNRGIEIDPVACEMLINHKSTLKIPIKWIPPHIDYNPVDRWVGEWKRIN